jgi:hypothetical protein
MPDEERVLFCSLTERKGRRAWPVAYYSVQVKSTADPWLFKDADSVQWLPGAGPPIVEFTVGELLDDERFSLFSGILRFWVLNDMDNIHRQQMGTRSASGPSRYKTNEIPPRPTGTFCMMLVPPDARTAAEATAANHLRQRADAGDKHARQLLADR